MLGFKFIHVNKRGSGFNVVTRTVCNDKTNKFKQSLYGHISVPIWVIDVENKNMRSEQENRGMEITW